MKSLKSFSQFINESKSLPIIDQILTAIEPTVLEMVNKVEKFHLEKEMEFSNWDREMARLNIIHDLLRSVEIYTQPNDTLLSISPRTSRKGNIEFFGTIQRGDETFFIETEAIVAGGYNIQSAHFRYLTKTNLPKTGNTEKAQFYATEIKRLSKLEKLNNEISNWEARIKKNEEHIAMAKTLTDEEVLQRYRSGENPGRTRMPEDPSWEEIVKRGADKNYDYDRNKFEKSKAEYRQSNIDHWRSQNITWKEQDISTGIKEIAKLRKKIEAAM